MRITAVLVIVLGLFACQPTTQKANVSEDVSIDKERVRQWLTQLSDEIILPNYNNVRFRSQQLVRRTEQLCLNRPDEHALLSARTTWRELYYDWYQTEAFLFGPAVKNDRDLHIFYRFPKAKVVKRLLGQGRPLTLDDIDEAGIGAQGIGTLEYLLFSYDKDLAEMTSEFSDAPTGVVRCSMLMMVAKDLEIRLANLHNDWLPGGNNYREAMINAGIDSIQFVSEKEVLDLLLSKFYQSIETSAQRRRNDEMFHSGLSAVAVQSTLDAAADIFEHGLQQLLIDTGHPDLAEKMASNFHTIDSIAVPPDMFHRRNGYPFFPEIDQYFGAALDLANMVRDEVAPALGVQLTLFDADGDF